MVHLTPLRRFSASTSDGGLFRAVIDSPFPNTESMPMTWPTDIGDRYLTGHEARLVRKAVDYMHDDIAAEFDGGTDEDEMPYGIPEFDQLTPAQKLATLAQVMHHLLEPTEPTPVLTALTAGAVAAIFSAVDRMVTSEIAADDEFRHDRDMRSLFILHYWRTLVLNVARENGWDPRDLPSVKNRDYDVWDRVLDSIIGRVLPNDDHMKAAKVLDASPEAAQRYREQHGIEEEYFVTVAPDPKDSELQAIRERLRALCEDEGHDA
jgi:hypothetical protein